MKCRSLLAAVLAGATFSFGLPAIAQTTPVTPVTTPVNPGFFFWSIGANGGIRHLPKWTYAQTFPGFGAAPPLLPPYEDAYRYNPKPWGAGPEFVMGYALNRASPLGTIGDTPRVEFGLSTFFGSANNSSAPAAGGFLNIPAVDGSEANSLIVPNEGTNAKLETTVYSGEVALRFKTAFKASPRFQIIPSVAAIGGLAFYRYKWESNFPGFELEGSVARVKETIRSWHFGGEAALQLKWKPGPRWSIHGGASFAVMHRRSDMDGLSQFYENFGGGFSNALIANVSDSDNTVAWRLGLNLGVTYDWGWARLSVSGFGYYDSAVPQIRNPQLIEGTQSSTAARLTHSGEWAYGGRIALTFPISMGR